MEELKLVMQTLAGLGATAKEGFIWWLIVDSALPKILLSAFGGALIWVIYQIALMVARDSTLDKNCANAVKEIAGELGVNIYGPHYSPSEIRLVIEAVKRIKNRS